MSHGNGTVERALRTRPRDHGAMPSEAVRHRSRYHAPEAIRVLVVDDHEAVRTGVKAALAEEPDLVPIGGVPNAERALDAARLFEPDVVVVDYQLPDEDGLTLARRLKALAGEPRVLIFSAYADAPLTVASVIAGADGILAKAGIVDGLTYAIRAVARGCPVRPRVGPAALQAVNERLDPNDSAILGMLLHSTPPGEIARVLGMTEHWLDVRRWAMLRQLTAPVV